MDGGVDAETAPLAAAAGADVFVAGSSIFGDVSQQHGAAADQHRPSGQLIVNNLYYEGENMQLGMVGLGRMGANMVRRLLQGGHECVVFDRSPKA